MDYNKVLDKVSTPCYVFDINNLKNRISYLKSKFNKEFNLVYAVKANSFIAKELDEDVERFEICSPGEFEICNNLGIDHSKMVISGVYKDYESINKMVSNYDDIGKYTIESVNQYELLKELATKYNRKLHILIRLTSGNQFGVTEEELKDIIKNNDNDHFVIDGIEYFSGTQKRIKKIEREIEYLEEFVNNIESELNFKINEIEYGPGLPIYYFQDEEFDEDSFLDEVNSLLSRFKDKEISIESGRSIASSCGYYLTKVSDMKSNKNGNHVMLDGGINHLVYYGQTMAMRIPHFDLLQANKEDEKETYTLYGSLCTINDIIVKGLEVNKLHLGDIFVFKNVGAYSVTEGISLFLSRNLPNVVLYKSDGEIIVVRNNKNTYEINYPNYE